MSYCCNAKGGCIILKNDDDMRKTAWILHEIGIDCDQNPNDPPTVEVYGSRLFRYDEDDFIPIAEMAMEGSFIRLLGEDDHVWTLKLKDGLVIDYDGEILWDHTEKENAGVDEEELVGQIIDIFEDYLDRKAAPDAEKDFLLELEDDVHIKGKDYDDLAGCIKATLASWGLLKEKGESA